MDLAHARTILFSQINGIKLMNNTFQSDFTDKPTEHSMPLLPPCAPPGLRLPLPPPRGDRQREKRARGGKSEWGAGQPVQGVWTVV